MIIWMEFFWRSGCPNNRAMPEYLSQASRTETDSETNFFGVTAASHQGHQTTSKTLSVNFLKHPRYMAEFKFLRMTETTVIQVGMVEACVCFS